MKNYKQKILSGLLASAMVFGMGATQLKANAAFTYDPVNGDDSFTFKKYLIVPQTANVPNVSFDFYAEPGTARSVATNDNAVMQVLAGVNADKITFTTATFAPANTTSTTAAATDIDVQRTADDRDPTLTSATGVEFDSSTEKFAVQTVTVNFSQVKFTEPGIYRYIVKEKTNNAHINAGIMHDNDVDRVLDVYVIHVDGSPAVPESWTYNGVTYDSFDDAKAKAAEDQGVPVDEVDDSVITHNPEQAAKDDHLEVASYVLHTEEDDVVIGTSMGSADVNADDEPLDDKTDGFTNEYKPYDLVVKKEVSGNQASRDKYFAITVKITDVPVTVGWSYGGKTYATQAEAQAVKDAEGGTDEIVEVKASQINPNDRFTVDLTNAELAPVPNDATTFTSMTNPSSVTGAELTSENGVTFYLQHGQSIAILGLPAGVSYNVAENAEDYLSAAAQVADHKNAITGILSVQDGKLRTDGSTVDTAPDRVVYTSYLNTRNGLIPTGILTVVGPAVVLILLAVAGLSIVMIGKRRKEESAN